jgi:hypothetical protein
MMGVVFDEVVARVDAPTQAAEGDTRQDEEPQSPRQESRRWCQQQATCIRRQLRLEAD